MYRVQTAALPLVALVLVASAALQGCVADLAHCELAGSDGVILNQLICPEACYTDADGDRVGDELVELEGSETCDGPGLATVSGDCDDEDDNNFPGNREVCDGLDNDCNGKPDFDVEEEEPDGTRPLVFSCTPRDFFLSDSGSAAASAVRIFLRGGSEVNGEPIDANQTQIEVRPGAEIRGRLRFRVLVVPGAENVLAGIGAVSWGQPRDESFLSFYDPGESGGAWDPTGYNDIEFDFEGSGGDALIVPDAPGQDLYLTVAGQAFSTPAHLAALTFPWYCCDQNDAACYQAAPTCAPVWDFDGDLREDLDVADLDDLDLASCTTFGVARVNHLVAAFGAGGGGCEVDGDDDCLGIHVPLPIGCASVKLFVEEGADDGADR